MSEFCSCDGFLGNTGTPSKQRAVSDSAILIAVPLVADDGTKNQISKSDVIDQAYIDAKINNTDPSKRWYPIGQFTNVTDERADPATESFSDGSSAIVQQGVRTYNGWLVGYAPNYIAQLDSFKCQEFGIFGVDSCGGLTGSISKDGLFLNPIRVNNASWNPGQYVKGSDSAAAKVTLSFEFSQLEKDKFLRQIVESEMTADLLAIEGLRDVNATISGESTTGFVAALTLPYDEFLNDVDFTGLVVGDFDLFNITDNAAVVITSTTEAPEGTYTFVIPAQDSNDVLRLRTNKNGFWLEELITIP
jgi:hypothetical protein